MKASEAINELNENTLKYYLPKYIPVVISLGIFQFIFIVFCILLFKKGSWKWIKKHKLSKFDNKKSIYIIYQLEEILLLITTSFLGIWILISEIFKTFQINEITDYYGENLIEEIFDIFCTIFGIITIIPISIIFVAIRKCSKSLFILFSIASSIELIVILNRLLLSYLIDYLDYYDIFLKDSALFSNIDGYFNYDRFFSDLLYDGDFSGIKSNINNNIIYRQRFFIAIPTLIFIVILFFNTWLCRLWIDENFIELIYGSEDKQILLQRIKELLKELWGNFLKFLINEPNLDLSIDKWKFVPESRLLLLNIVQITVLVDEEITNAEYDKDDENIGVKNDKNNNEFAMIIDVTDVDGIIFNAKSDVMIQTNYPFRNVPKKDASSTSLSTPRVEYYYYEMTIFSNKNKTIIAIGLATKNHSINRLPGCDTHSVGFHSDEGRIFHNERYTGSKYDEKWGDKKDVIGCGYYPDTGQVFFTMNGKNLGIAYTGLFYDEWYPTIGSNGDCSLVVNFGQEEFKYKEANGMSVAGKLNKGDEDKY
ncbi:uncharacterized protein OCT59_028904 [Rhizophagus irregularis]|nr:hypothetical protein OCT59_028904 [Rhizophagus irregularis]